jgi:hypothetical protein
MSKQKTAKKPMENKNITAVEWYTKQLKRIGLSADLIGHLTNEALKMEKEQIKKSYTKGREDWVKYEIEKQDNENAIVPTPNKYYTETYGNK